MHNEPPAVEQSAGILSTQQTLEPSTTADVQADWFMRCDSVAFPPGGCALTHTHRAQASAICSTARFALILWASQRTMTLVVPGMKAVLTRYSRRPMPG